MKIGYGRVSTKDQNPDRQIEKFKALGIEDRFIFVDKQTGAVFNRKDYEAVKRILREGDEIYFDALDRLGRDYDGIIAEWKDITRRIKADIICLDNPELFNSRKFREMGDIGKVMEDTILAMLAYVAEQGRKRIRQTQREGIDLALAKKLPYGRPKAIITDKLRSVYLQWKKGKITAAEAMKRADIKRTTFYKLVKQLDEEYKGVNLFLEVKK